MKHLVHITILIGVVALAGCEDKQAVSETSAEPTPVVKHSVEELDKLIRLPAEPKSVKWSRIKTVRRSNDSGLVAVFRFSPEDYEKIIEESEKPNNVRGDAVVNREFYEQWVPDEVKEKLGMELHQDGEAIILVGRPYLKPNLFVDLNGMSPYVHGKVYPLGMGYIAVGLYTM